MSRFDWHQYVELAESLLDAPVDGAPQEAQWRSAASRAYYGAFCTARNILEGDGFAIDDGPEAHGDVIHALNRSSDPERQQAGSHLTRLRKRRNAADYDDVVSPRFEKQTEAVVKTARRVLAALTDDPPGD